MESERPAPPVAERPGLGATAAPETHFAWEGVSDPSGISYLLQIATDSEFSSLVLERSGISQPEYTLTGEEALAPNKEGGFYYWRVKAVDGTFTESDWTITRSFSVGSPQKTTIPGWVKYLGIGAGVAVAAVFILRARRKAVE
jgi:hypothetical protein